MLARELSNAGALLARDEFVVVDMVSVVRTR